METFWRLVGLAVLVWLLAEVNRGLATGFVLVLFWLWVAWLAWKAAKRRPRPPVSGGRP